MAEMFKKGDRVVGKTVAQFRAHIMSDNFVTDAVPPGSTRVLSTEQLVVAKVIKRDDQLFLSFEDRLGEFSAGFFDLVAESETASA